MHHGRISKEIAHGLIELRSRIAAAKIPSSKIDETINIATWNIREFGKKRRSEAAIHYIAEIIGQFDLVGVVELRDNLTDLGRVLDILGPYWRAVYSDMVPDAGGNHERIAYVYDRRAVTFNGMASTATPPRKKKGLTYLPEKAWWRSPYLATFRSGNFDFLVISAHIQWGTVEGRQQELELLADWVEGKRREPSAVDKDLIVMGDFNIPDRNGKLFKAISKHGLKIPSALADIEHGSNLEKNKRYDQILHYPNYPENFTGAGGVLDFFIDESHIEPLFGALNKTDFTYQISDHLPLWTQMNTDIDGQILEQVVKG